MRKIKKKIYTESKFIGVHLGMVITTDGVLLVDCPLKVDETKEWLSIVPEFGTPRYMVLLDAHPDRVLGARIVDIPLVAQERTLETIREWADTFKGGAHPIGAEADRLKRVTGVQRSAPEIVFSTQMEIQLGDIRFNFVHRPGPQAGAAWILLPEEKVAFIGDSVVLDEPPYIVKADLSGWIDSLDELRGPPMSDYTLISSQGGPVKRDDVNATARFLRKALHRLERLSGGDRDDEQLDLCAAELIEDFKPPAPRYDQALLRLKVGLSDLRSGDG